MAEVNLLDNYPKSNRPIDDRGRLTDEDRAIARRFGKDYFDGTRMQGYGGYRYHEKYWKKTVERFRDYWKLDGQASILDVGCAKGFMLYDFIQLMPDLQVKGIDISEYAIKNALEPVKPFLSIGNATALPFEDNSFDAVISINTIHNLPLDECKKSLMEIQRVSRKHSFVTVDAWRTEEEKEKLLKWNLTALTYMSTDEWEKLFHAVGYTGDYYWFIA